MKRKFLHIETTRHGSEVVYFRRGRAARVRLPPMDSPEFDAAYSAALNGEGEPYRPGRITTAATRAQKIESALREAIPGAAARAKARGLTFNIDLDWALAEARRQQFRCALTGIEFYSAHSAPGKKNPFAISMDRIEPSAGYTRANVRLVLLAVNVMLLDWGEPVLERVMTAYRRRLNSERKGNVASLTLGECVPHLVEMEGKSND